ncbi:hypothetical protein BFJ63_vAg20162, partial [Fusarium oxysporum f. sp. narcissi]
RPPALTIRGRSQGREGSAERSPSSPLPLSAAIHYYKGSKDEEDCRVATGAQEVFRNKHSRSGSRELEERCKSLAKHARTPSVPHPTEFSPALAVTVGTAEPKPLPDDIPPRSATRLPQRSMYARSGPVIGLLATSKTIRLIIEGNHYLSGSTPRPNVPAIPVDFSQRYSPESSPQQSSEREQPVAKPSLTLLPSTVYQSPTRPPIPRSMSAPIPDKPDQPPARFVRKKGFGRIEEV